jgi:hypothetical protein
LCRVLGKNPLVLHIYPIIIEPLIVTLISLFLQILPHAKLIGGWIFVCGICLFLESLLIYRRDHSVQLDMDDMGEVGEYVSAVNQRDYNNEVDQIKENVKELNQPTAKLTNNEILVRFHKKHPKLGEKIQKKSN